MAALASDLLTEVGDPGSATNLEAPGYTIGATSINVTSTGNWPTTTGVVFGIDTFELVDGLDKRVAGSYCVFEGVVTSGTAIGSLDLIFGTPQNYAAGSNTRVYIIPSSQWVKRLVQWGTTHADQDGTLKAGAVDNAAVLAANVVTANAIAGSAVTPEKILTGAGTTWAWQNWTPTLTNLSGGTITYAKYVQIGKLVHFSFKYTLAGAGVAGDIFITVPVAMHARYATSTVIDGVGNFLDTGSASYTGNLSAGSTTSISIRCIHTDGARATIPRPKNPTTHVDPSQSVTFS